MLKIWQEISFLNFFQLNEPQDDGQGEDAEPGQDAAQGDGGEGGGEGGSETGEDQMAAHQAMTSTRYSTLLGIFFYYSYPTRKFYYSAE